MYIHQYRANRSFLVVRHDSALKITMQKTREKRDYSNEICLQRMSLLWAYYRTDFISRKSIRCLDLEAPQAPQAPKPTNAVMCPVTQPLCESPSFVSVMLSSVTHEWIALKVGDRLYVKTWSKETSLDKFYQRCAAASKAAQSLFLGLFIWFGHKGYSEGNKKLARFFIIRAKPVANKMA